MKVLRFSWKNVLIYLQFIIFYWLFSITTLQATTVTLVTSRAFYTTLDFDKNSSAVGKPTDFCFDTDHPR